MITAKVETRPGHYEVWTGDARKLLQRAARVMSGTLSPVQMRRLARRFQYVDDPDEIWQHPKTTLRTMRGDCDDWYLACAAAGFPAMELSREARRRHVRPRDVPDMAGLTQLAREAVQPRDGVGFWNPLKAASKAMSRAKKYLVKQVKRHGPGLWNIARRHPMLAPVAAAIPNLYRMAKRASPMLWQVAQYHPALAAPVAMARQLARGYRAMSASSTQPGIQPAGPGFQPQYSPPPSPVPWQPSMQWQTPPWGWSR